MTESGSMPPKPPQSNRPQQATGGQMPYGSQAPLGSGVAPPGAAYQPEPIPWEVPGAEILRSLYETVKLFVLDPKPAFSRMARSGENVPLRKPIIYAATVKSVGVLCAMIFVLAIQIPIVIATLSHELGDDLSGGFVVTVILGLLVVFVILLPVLSALGVVIQAGILHLMLLLVRAATASFESTLRVVCYATTAEAANVIPFVGGYVALPWVIVLQVIGTASVHGCSYGRATLAVLLPLLLCCGLGIASFFLAIFAAIAAA